MSDRERGGVRLCARARRADPLHAAHPRLLLRRSAMARPIAGRITPRCRSRRCKAAGREPHRADHHGGALSARQGRPGAGRALQRRRQVLHGLFRRHRGATTICASRMSATTARTRRPRTATPGFRCRRCARWRRAGRIGEVAPRFHGAPTNRSHRVTLDRTARRCWRAAARTRSTPRPRRRIDRSATRP